MLRYYKTGVDDEKSAAALRASLQAAGTQLLELQQERCYMIALAPGSPPLTAEEESRLTWLISETFEAALTTRQSQLPPAAAGRRLIEVGPRLTFCTASSANAVSICSACGLTQISRVEFSRRYLLKTSPALSPAEVSQHAAALHDRMTECVYETPLDSFDHCVKPVPVTTVPLLAEGRAALAKLSDELGFGFDDADLDYYTKLFCEQLKRDPTSVECFDMAQSNSEHSRHWFFSGIQVVDGETKPTTLFQMVKATLKGGKATDNSVIAFHDNSSAIKGYAVQALRPGSATGPAPYGLVGEVQHILLTAETHNFPSGVAPFPGAETGTGGRLRDVHATGRGAFVGAGISSYCTGNLHIPGYKLPWEAELEYPDNLAPPLQIMVQASNGASDYGNKFGEPVLCGFARTFGMTLPNGERREWIKPIMFSAGLGQIPASQADKGKPEEGMWVVKLGGPAYRIGMGGGAASSRLQDKAQANLDFDAVQRGDAEMENKMNRVIRACAELGDKNPIVSIHDQGAGGNGNVLKEICEPLGAKIEARDIYSGDSSLSIMELWGAEYQENCALLLRPEHKDLFADICRRERSTPSFLGRVTGDGRIVLHDSNDGSSPVDLPLELVLGDMPKKTFVSDTEVRQLKPLVLPPATTVASALDLVLRLPSVASKRFLTNKVDRSVSGLIAQQQCVGPLHIPLADVGIIAQTHQDLTGGATAVGEQPIKGMLSPAAMARLATAEALTNLVMAATSGLGEVKCSANWMWAAKLPGEGAAMYEACEAMSTFMQAIGVAVDGGKDSLSMAARVKGETVKAPGALVITVYAPCPDITLTLTPDLKAADSVLLLVDVADGKRRLGGSALAQVFSQLGDTPPDVEQPDLLAGAFEVVQTLMRARKLRGGHDVSDGGLLVAALEMAFAGDLGLELALPKAADPFAALFAEEVGVLLEVSPADEAEVLKAFKDRGVPCARVGKAATKKQVSVSVGGTSVLSDSVPSLRDVWEATSFELEKLQASPACVEQEQKGLHARHTPAWALTYTPSAPAKALRDGAAAVAILRQEGSNGDREMAAAVFAAGLQPWDVAMSDLLSGAISLERFRGIFFVGGFSYADTLDSAKGWAGSIRFNKSLKAQFDAFRARSDTFSLGVCNGCQLMALLGWVPGADAGADCLAPEQQPRFVHNQSGRFESRWSAVTVLPSPALLLKGMEGATMGVWVAHGEGRAHFPHKPVYERVMDKALAPLRYVDDELAITEAYPHNPNGAPQGIAALCSEDGRHLAMMPHPERCYLSWQSPWVPPAWRAHASGPWLRLFQNARAFCDKK